MKLKILILLSLLVFAGCLTTRSQLKQETTLNKIQELKADDQARYTEYDSQFREMNGRFDVLDRKIEDLGRSTSKKSEDESLNQQLLDNKFKLIEEALLKIESEFASLRAEISELKKSKAQAAATKNEKPKKGNFSQAEDDFDNKKWKTAIVGYQKYREMNPKGRKYSEATYKIGVCFTELGMKSEAKAFLDEVVEKFPKSAEAKKAQYRLKNLK